MHPNLLKVCLNRHYSGDFFVSLLFADCSNVVRAVMLDSMRKVRLRVKEIAQAKGMSRTRLHHRSEVAYTTIRTVFRDPYDDGITLHTLARLAEALGVPTADLIEDEHVEE